MSLAPQSQGALPSDRHPRSSRPGRPGKRKRFSAVPDELVQLGLLQSRAERFWECLWCQDNICDKIVYGSSVVLRGRLDQRGEIDIPAHPRANDPDSAEVWRNFTGEAHQFERAARRRPESKMQRVVDVLFWCYYSVGKMIPAPSSMEGPSSQIARSCYSFIVTSNTSSRRLSW